MQTPGMTYVGYNCDRKLDRRRNYTPPVRRYNDQ